MIKIKYFTVYCLFLHLFHNIEASSSLEHSGIYYLDVVKLPENSTVVHILDRDERPNIEKTSFQDFGKLTRIIVALTANQHYQFGDHVLEKNDKVTTCYHFDDYKMIQNIGKFSPMRLPLEFVPMTEWQAVITFANTLLGEVKFTTDDSVENVIKFMNSSDRDHHKKEYQEKWVESLFWRKET